MADEVKPEPASDDEPPKLGKHNVDRDPDLVEMPLGEYQLRKARMRVGALTAAGVVFLSIFFLIKLNPDRRFAGNDEAPQQASVADLAGGNVDDDAFVTVQAELLMAHAIRAQTARNSVGLRVVPVKGSGNRLWVVLPGDGWAHPNDGGYVGRVRKLGDLPFAGVLADFLAQHPRPLFARSSAVRAGFASGKVATVAGDEISVRDNDKIGFDVIDPNAAIVVGTYNERLPNLAAWTTALGEAGVTLAGSGRDDRERAYFDVKQDNAAATVATQLEKAALWAARVDPVTHHHETTWRALKQSGPSGFVIAGIMIPDAQLDLIGLYVVRDVPANAYAVITGEKPQDYWYVLPVAIVVLLIGALFAWALVRAIKRELDNLRSAKAAAKA